MSETYILKSIQFRNVHIINKCYFSFTGKKKAQILIKKFYLCIGTLENCHLFCHSLSLGLYLFDTWQAVLEIIEKKVLYVVKGKLILPYKLHKKGMSENLGQ